MPDIVRSPLRMDCLGLDLVSPLDRMPPGAFPYLSNVRVLVEGRLDSRPGYTEFNPTSRLPTGSPIHSIRRLNDPDDAFAPSGYTYIVGQGTILWGGVESIFSQLDSGYSGDPLSLITFRPENSPEAWMYVYDRSKQSKVNPAGTIRQIGVAPPTTGPTLVYGLPANGSIEYTLATTGFVAYGLASSPALVDRTNGSAPTIGAIFYDVGTTGWCCINPYDTSPDTSWFGERMIVLLNNGGANAEYAVVREIHNPIANTYIEAIAYDSGTTGPCSIILNGYPAGVERHTFLQTTSEVLVVQAVIPSPDGLTYSVRTSTRLHHTAGTGSTVTGLISWYLHTTATHVITEPIAATSVVVSDSGAGTAVLAKLLSKDLSVSDPPARPISIANDWLHCSLFLQNPQDITEIDLLIDIDPATTTVGGGGNAFKNNYWQWKITPAQLNLYGPGNVVGDSWTEILIPISSGQRFGSDPTLNFSTTRAIGVQAITTAACSFGFNSWYFFGTYGPVIQPNSPTGYLYESVNRDSSTGAQSVPGPPSLYQMFPLREDVIVTPQTTTAAGVDSLDVYRQGGSLTNFVYVGTAVNNVATPQSVDDVQPDATIAGNPIADTTRLQPWTSVGLPLSGNVTVVGTSVIWVSGNQFPLNLLSGTVVQILGTAYQLYGQPTSATTLTLNTSAGNHTNVPYSIASPGTAGNPLPFAFGPLEGPFSPVTFALGDPVNGGTLYYSNSADMDSASDVNTLEITAPSEPLISGDVWNGMAFVGSRDNVFLVRYSYLATVGASSNLSYQFSRLPSLSGIWSRWACKRGPDGVYFLGRDGLYRATDQGTQNISDGQLYSLFPHDGAPAKPVNGFFPVDMTKLTDLRISCADQDVYFDYTDTNGNGQTLRYQINQKRFFPHTYNDVPTTHYLVEASASSPNQQEILLLSRTLGYVYLAGGNLDDTAGIVASFSLPSMDGGDERGQKLYVDQMTDADGTGTLNAQITFNNQTVNGPLLAFTLAGPRIQSLENISSLASLNLYRNISCTYTWTGGPDGPRIYAFEPSGYVQPYLSSFMVTQFINLSFPGWKHHRRLYAGYISNSVILFTIKTQDDRTYGPYALPSTGGQFRIIPVMLDQGILGLAFAYQLDGQGQTFALFPEAFTLETKSWTEPDYIELAVFKT